LIALAAVSLPAAEAEAIINATAKALASGIK